MTMVPMSVLKSDIFAVIQFHTLENVARHEIQHRLCTAYKNPNIVTKSVNHWVKSSRVQEHFLV